jgi:hypothetical protein
VSSYDDAAGKDDARALAGPSEQWEYGESDPYGSRVPRSWLVQQEREDTRPTDEQGAEMLAAMEAEADRLLAVEREERDA